MKGHIRLTKVTTVNFPSKKMPLANLFKNDATFYLVIHFNDFFLNIEVFW